MKTPRFKIVEVNNGFCQITYKTKNPLGQTIFYCLQDNGLQGGVRLLRATRDYEPSHEVPMTKQTAELFDMPKGDSHIEIECRKYLENKLNEW